MGKLLYVKSSPRRGRSRSTAIADVFVDAYRKAHPQDEIETLDLWSAALPEFDGATLEAKYHVLHAESFTPEEAEAWQQVVDVCERFKSADRYLFSVPMWNFGIPYKLKHLIDVLVQPGQTFSYSPDTGYSGLVTGKPVVVVYARGGAYSSPESVGMDMQRTYMEMLLGFIGFTDVHSIVVEPTLAEPAQVEAAEEAARTLARSLAETI